MATFTISDGLGVVTISCGGKIQIYMDNIISVLERTTDKVYLGFGVNLVVDGGYYWFREYGEDMNLKNCICITESEWSDIVSSVSDISAPPVYNGICTHCKEYIPFNEHIGCFKANLRMDVFASTEFGKCVLYALKEATLKRYKEIVPYDIEIDSSMLKYAYAYIKRDTIAHVMNCTNVNILKYESHFQNLKMCSYDYVISSIKV